MVKRGEIWWADLPDPVASEPGYRRPVLIVQSDDFNRSRINTVMVVAVTTNLRLAQAPGNVLLPARGGGLPKESVANVSQVLTIDRQFLGDRVGKLDGETMHQLDDGLRMALAL